MTIDKHEPIYPFRAESFDIVKNPANTNDWRVSENLEDKFYGYGFVTGPNVPMPKCANEESWHDEMAMCKYMNTPYVPLYILEQYSNKPIC